MRLVTHSCCVRVFIQGFAPAGATRGLCDRPLDSFASPSKLLDFCRNKLACEPFVPPSRNKNQETWVCTPNVSKGRPQTFVCFYCPLVASAEAKPLRQSQIANKIKGVCSHTQRGRNPSAVPLLRLHPPAGDRNLIHPVRHAFRQPLLIHRRHQQIFLRRIR